MVIRSEPRQTVQMPATSTPDLLKEAIEDVRDLVRIEVALARDEFDRELDRTKKSGIAFGGAAVAGVLGLALLLVALGLVISLSALPVFIIGLVLVVGAAGTAYFAYEKVEKKPMEPIKRRVEADVRLVKERVS